MKVISMKILLLTFMLMSFVNLKTKVETTYKVDTESSIINWKGYKPGGSREGTLKLISGELILEQGTLKGGSFVANMSTINDTDGSGKLEKHLKSPDFFDVQVYANSKFEITSSSSDQGKLIVTGNLTIKDITKQITFTAVLEEFNNGVTLTSDTFQINRADFNVKYRSKSFFNNLKDKFIKDKFDLKVKIGAIK